MTTAFHPELLQEGDTVRHYRVVRRLGGGGFATAFLVESGGRLFTMKMAVRPPDEDAEDEIREDERAFREVVCLGHFRHPNLVAVHEMGRWPDPEKGYFFFVTDYVPGASFNTWRWRTEAPLRRWVGVLAELALVLAELHERGVCHRDIKADNVLVRDGDDKAFLIDFGAAFLPGAYTLTRGLPPVTPHNMPPEVAAFLRGGEWEQGINFPAHPSADLYAFGALLYEALTDCHPFNPRLPAETLLLAIEFLPPVEPVRLDPRVPSELNALVMRLLAKEPERRPPSARAVHEELMRLLKRHGDTAPWREPYGFPPARGGNVAPEVRLLPEGQRAPEVRLLPAISATALAAEQAVEARSQPPEPELTLHALPTDERPPEGEEGRSRPRVGGRRWLAVSALVLGLLGLGSWLVRVACASTWERAGHGVASTPLAPPASTEKGTPPMFSSMPDAASCPSFTLPRSLREVCVLLGACAASVNLLACASAPVRPDMGGFLERCPSEALETAARLKLGRVVSLELVNVTWAGVEEDEAFNVRTGPMEGWMVTSPVEANKLVAHRVTGEAKVFPDRVYIQFDRIYLDETWPTRGRVPSPICAVAVHNYGEEFGEPTFAAMPNGGVEVDPAKVDRSPDAAVINSKGIPVYVQRPGFRFPK
jgi:serine/threonine-protein kinase